MLSIGRVASGQAAVSYFTGDQDARPAAGCGVGYYTRNEATAGRWVGSGAAALGLVGELDPAGARVLAGLLDGVGPDGVRLVEPVLRADPAGRVPALPIVTAARAAAAEAGTDLPVLLGSELYRHWHTAAKTLGGGSKGRGIRADVAAAIARRCGLDPAAVYEANTAGGADAFRAALARAGARVDGRRAGLDLTFSAPKSVSLLAAFAPGAVAEQVRAAHDAAVTEALGWLEPRVARAARGHHGDGQTVARVRTDGLVGVAFAHEVSRALDPQLHTHVVVANLARAGDGRWSALDTKAAYRHSRTAGHLYQAVLRAELTARLGVDWGPVTRGTAEVAGIPRRLRRVFSKRSDAIAHQLSRAGLEGPRAAQAACLASRDPKTHANPDDLRRRWRAEAAAAKVDPDTVVAEALGQASPPAVDEQALAQRLLGPCGLTEQRTWFGYDDLLQAVCSHLPAGAPVDAPTVERLAARVLAHPDTIPLHDSGEQPRWTTRDLLAVEQHALTTADRLHHLPAAPVDPLLVEYALRVHRLTGEQADLVRTLTLHPGRLSVVVGPAGAGKTAALAAARTAWGHDQQLVVGCATAALAAQQLQHATGITTTTVATILRGLQDPRPSGWLPPGGVLVVDEAGMVGTRDLATLLAAAEQHHARLVLVGDPAQLPEIDAGGLFAHLARHPDAALTDNRRQQADWERDALAALRAGSTGPALGAYLQRGHVHIDPTPADRTDRIVEDYLTARQVLTGADDVLVLTATRAHAAHLNTAIRATLHATGHLGTDQLDVDTPAGPRGYSTGDQVLVTRNDPARGLLNGDRATVTDLHPDHGALTIHTRDGRDLTLPGPYLADGRLDHAYAMTVHKAQGQTSQVTLVAAAPSMTRETAYTALSRGRLGNYLYLTPDPDTPTPSNADAVGAWIADTALAETAHAIHRSGAHQLATTLRSVAAPPTAAERSALAGPPHPEAPSSPRGLSI